MLYEVITSITSIDLSGVAPPFEEISDTCPTSLVPDATCSVTLAFAPRNNFV